MLKKIRRIFSGVLALTLFSTIVGPLVFTGVANAADPISALASDYGFTPGSDGKVPKSQLENSYVLEWIDAAHLRLTFKTAPGRELIFVPKKGDYTVSAFMDQRNEDNDELRYVIDGWPNGAYSRASADVNGNTMYHGISKVKIDIDFMATSNGGAVDSGGGIEINVPNPDIGDAYFKWVDSATIDTVADMSIDSKFSYYNSMPFHRYKRVGSTNVFTAEEETVCADRVIVEPGSNNTRIKYYLLGSDFPGDFGANSIHDAPDEIGAAGCKYATNRMISNKFSADDAVPPTSNKVQAIANVKDAGLAAGTGVDDVAISADSVANASGDTCETSGFNLSWLFCGFVNATASLTTNIFEHIIEPYLRESPVNTSPGTVDEPNPVYQVWASMRNISDLILVFALLFIVFGQSIGGGMVDAYTAKKALPRILAAAVAVNLSLFIVTALIDIFNVIGAGIGDLIVGPFKKTILGKFQTSSGTEGGGAVVGVGAIIALVIGALVAVSLKDSFNTGKAGGTLLGGRVAGVGGLASNGFVHFFLLFVLLPAVLITLAIFSTLVIRRGLITILVVTAPIAFALFALPGTEKYFKKWGKALIQTLMVYPIITVIFSVGSILAAISYNVNDQQGGAFSGFVAAIVALIVVVISLVLVPFSFKIAGGLIGNLYQTVTSQGKRFSEAVKGSEHNPRSLRNRAKYNMRNTNAATRSNMLGSLRSYNKADYVGGFGKRMSGLGMRVLAIGDPDEVRAQMNEEKEKRTSSKVGMGADYLERAFFAKKWDKPDEVMLDANGKVVKDENGNPTYFRQGAYYSTYRNTKGGYDRHASGDYAASHAKFDGDESAVQSLMKYELGKLANDRDLYGVNADGETIYDPSKVVETNDKWMLKDKDGNRTIDSGLTRRQRQLQLQPLGSFMSELPDTLRNSGLSLQSAIHSTTGTNFAVQSARKELKHTSLYEKDGKWQWKQGEAKFVQDFAENIGSYQAATGKTSPINNLSRLYDKVAAIPEGDLTDEQRTMKSDLIKIATGLDTRMQRGDPSVQSVDDGTPRMGSAGGGLSGGSGRVNDAIANFILKVRGPLNGPSGSAPPTQPTPPTTPPVQPPTPPTQPPSTPTSGTLNIPRS